jgi:hypothetical protein
LFLGSAKPPCPPDSTVAKKRKRYMSWVKNPEQIARELDAYKATIDRVKGELSKVQSLVFTILFERMLVPVGAIRQAMVRDLSVVTCALRGATPIDEAGTKGTTALSVFRLANLSYPKALAS